MTELWFEATLVEVEEGSSFRYGNRQVEWIFDLGVGITCTKDSLEPQFKNDQGEWIAHLWSSPPTKNKRNRGGKLLRVLGVAEDRIKDFPLNGLVGRRVQVQVEKIYGDDDEYYDDEYRTRSYLKVVDTRPSTMKGDLVTEERIIDGGQLQCLECGSKICLDTICRSAKGSRSARIRGSCKDGHVWVVVIHLPDFSVDLVRND